MQRTASIFLFAAAVFLGGPRTVVAETITVGGSLAGSYCVPFGCSPGSIYQQIISNTFFGGPSEITRLAFLNTIADSGGDQYVDPAYYELWVSTSPRAVAALHPTDFAGNRGADATRVFAGMMGGSRTGEVPPGPSSRLTFDFSTAFLYDPSAGSLLVEVRKTGGVFFGDDGTYLDYTTDPRMRFTHNFFNGGFSGPGGLVAEITATGLAPAPTPEPATLLLLGGGLAGVLARRRQLRA